MSLELVIPGKGAITRTNPVATTTAVLLCAENIHRKVVMFQNKGTETVYIGPANVAATGANQGYALAQGETFKDEYSFHAWYGITASGSSVVHVTDAE